MTAKKIRFRDGEAKTIRSKIEALADKYVYSEPFPVPDEDMMELITDTIPLNMQQCLAEIREFDRDILSESSHAYVAIEGVALNQSNIPNPIARLSVRGTYADRFIDTGRRVLTKDSPHHEAAFKWLHETYERRTIITRLKRHLGTSFHACNTPGQLKTVFPALVEFLPERHIEALSRSVRATRWPTGCGVREDFLAVSEEFANLPLLLKMLQNVNRPVRAYRVTIS